MFHAFGNNPIKYTDPDGRFDWETNTVTENDNLWNIAEEFNKIYETSITYYDIATANGIPDPNFIAIGQKLDLNIFLPKKKETSVTSSYKKSPPMAYYQAIFGAGAALVGGGNFEVGYVWDSLGNKGIALSGDIGCGISADINMKCFKALGNFIYGNAVSDIQSYTCIYGTVYDFEGPYATAKVHVIGGLTTDLKNTADTRFSVEMAVGGGTFWGRTKVFVF